MTDLESRPRVTPPAALADVVGRIVGALSPEQVWLAAPPPGGEGPASGVWELVAVVADAAPEGSDDLMTAWTASRSPSAQVDLVVVRDSDLLASADLVNTPSHRLCRDGVVLWERTGAR